MKHVKGAENTITSRSHTVRVKRPLNYSVGKPDQKTVDSIQSVLSKQPVLIMQSHGHWSGKSIKNKNLNFTIGWPNMYIIHYSYTKHETNIKSSVSRYSIS